MQVVHVCREENDIKGVCMKYDTLKERGHNFNWMDRSRIWYVGEPHYSRCKNSLAFGNDQSSYGNNRGLIVNMIFHPGKLRQMSYLVCRFLQ